MIIGIGTDIIDTRRIKKNINKYGKKFKRRCFSNNEITRSENSFATANSYAKSIAKAIVITGKAVEIIPVPKPEMMFVADPVSDAFEISCAGFLSSEV